MMSWSMVDRSCLRSVATPLALEVLCCIRLLYLETRYWFLSRTNHLQLLLLNMLREQHERLIDIDASQGRALIHIHQFVVPRKQHCLLSEHLALLRLPEHDIQLVCHEGYLTVFRAHIAHLLQPVLQVEKRVELCDIVNKDHPQSIPVVVGCHGFERLTARCVPQLDVDSRPILQLNYFACELDTCTSWLSCGDRLPIVGSV